jgi:hypothetical protein
VPDDGGQGALINSSSGRWALDVPHASLHLRRVPQGEIRPAAYLPILSVRF